MIARITPQNTSKTECCFIRTVDIQIRTIRIKEKIRSFLFRRVNSLSVSERCTATEAKTCILGITIVEESTANILAIRTDIGSSPLTSGRNAIAFGKITYIVRVTASPVKR